MPQGLEDFQACPADELLRGPRSGDDLCDCLSELGRPRARWRQVGWRSQCRRAAVDRVLRDAADARRDARLDAVRDAGDVSPDAADATRAAGRNAVRDPARDAALGRGAGGLWTGLMGELPC